MILLVEDDLRVSAALADALRRRGHTVHRASSVAQALLAPKTPIVLLDLNLPDGDGLDLCRDLRRQDPGVAIIALTARGENGDKVAGLTSGLDDYVVKPFSMAELVARMDAVMRRTVQQAAPVLRVGGLRMDVERREASRDGRRIPLSRKEFDVLARLASEPGAVVSRERLIIQTWGTPWRGAGRTLDVHMAKLRAKLGTPTVVETVRGVGFRLQAPDQDAGVR